MGGTVSWSSILKKPDISIQGEPKIYINVVQLSFEQSEK